MRKPLSIHQTELHSFHAFPPCAPHRHVCVIWLHIFNIRYMPQKPKSCFVSLQYCHLYFLWFLRGSQGHHFILVSYLLWHSCLRLTLKSPRCEVCSIPPESPPLLSLWSVCCLMAAPDLCLSHCFLRFVHCSVI